MAAVSASRRRSIGRAAQRRRQARYVVLHVHRRVGDQCPRHSQARPGGDLHRPHRHARAARRRHRDGLRLAATISGRRCVPFSVGAVHRCGAGELGEPGACPHLAGSRSAERQTRRDHPLGDRRRRFGELDALVRRLRTDRGAEGRFTRRDGRGFAVARRRFARRRGVVCGDLGDRRDGEPLAFATTSVAARACCGATGSRRHRHLAFGCGGRVAGDSRVSRAVLIRHRLGSARGRQPRRSVRIAATILAEFFRPHLLCLARADDRLRRPLLIAADVDDSVRRHGEQDPRRLLGRTTRRPGSSDVVGRRVRHECPRRDRYHSRQSRPRQGRD